MRKYFLGAKVAGVGLLVQKVLVKDLQLYGPRQQCTRSENKKRNNERESAGELTGSLLFCICSATHCCSMT